METNKMTIELEWKDDKNFNVDEVINSGWEELKKCNKVDVVFRTNRTCYANMD